MVPVLVANEPVQTGGPAWVGESRIQALLSDIPLDRLAY